MESESNITFRILLHMYAKLISPICDIIILYCYIVPNSVYSHLWRVRGTCSHLVFLCF